MNREMQIILEVNNQAEVMYHDAEKLGNHAAAALKRARAQLTGLETIAESTSKTSDVFDYIKKQTARNYSWRQTHSDSPDEGFGARLRRYLDTTLKTRVDIICKKPPLNIGDTSEEDRRERRRIQLLLMRQFIRQMVVQYEFQVNVGDAQNKPGGQGRDAQRGQGNTRRGS